jgi:hypothetical protein
MKPITPDALRIVGLRNRQPPGNIRKVAVECRIEADELRNAGLEAPYGLDQLDLVRQMIRRKGDELPQRGEHIIGDELRVEQIRPAVNDAMAHAGERIRPEAIADALQHLVDRCRARHFVNAASAQGQRF